MARIGILSGTFDPVHKGHVSFCLAALAAAGLDRVILLPEPEPRGKAHTSSLKHRVAMLELAVRLEPRLEVLQLPGRRFTVADTLPQLERHFAGDELSLLLGSDVIAGMAHGWPGLELLLEHMQLIIGLRAHDTEAYVRGQLAAIQRAWPQAGVRARFVDGPYAGATSTIVRQSPSAVSPSVVPPPVADYIATHQLYAFAA